MSGKQLELLKEIVPGLLNVVVIGTSTQPGNAHAVRETELAAAGFGVKLHYLNVPLHKDIEAAFGAAKKGRTDAMVVLAGPVLLSHRTQVAESAVKSRIPVTYQASEYVEAGGLMTYGVTIADLH